MSMRSTTQPVIVTGGGGVPAGAAVMVDSVTASLKATVAETNATPSDVVTAYVRASIAETNATPTDAAKLGLRGPVLGETNATPSEGFALRAVWAASSTFVVPPNVTSMTGECWGGGKGGSVGTQTGGTGGNGGDYARATISVTPGETLTLTVAATSAVGANGGDTSILRSATPLVRAKGGGSATANVGTTTFTGGTGAAGTLLGTGGGGGGSAGDASNGGNASGGTAGTAGTAGGGAGGAGATGAGVAGNVPGGGGGGGGGSLTSPGAGSTGAAGRIRLSWVAV